MAAQTVPNGGAYGTVTKVSNSGEPYSQEIRQFMISMIVDMVTQRNALDAAVTIFNAHTHKTPTSNPGATSTPTSDAGGSGSTGGTATSMVAPASITSAP